MSVKKKSTKKHTNSNDDIQKAIDQIPSLIMKEVSEKKSKQQSKKRTQTQQTEVKHTIAPVYKSPIKSGRWMWTGVALFTIMIFVLWIMNVTNIFYDEKFTNNPAIEALKNSKKDFQNIIKTFEEKNPAPEQKQAIEENIQQEIDKEEAKLKAENALSEIINQNTTSTP